MMTTTRVESLQTKAVLILAQVHESHGVHLGAVTSESCAYIAINNVNISNFSNNTRKTFKKVMHTSIHANYPYGVS